MILILYFIFSVRFNFSLINTTFVIRKADYVERLTPHLIIMIQYLVFSENPQHCLHCCGHILVYFGPASASGCSGTAWNFKHPLRVSFL